MLPLRSAHRSKQNRLALLTNRHRLRRQCLPHRINRRPSNQLPTEIKPEPGLGAYDLQNLDGLSHDFRTNAVTGENCD